MTLTQTCEACGRSIVYEYATGDRSGVCWREHCRKARRLRAELCAIRNSFEQNGRARADSDRMNEIRAELTRLGRINA